MAIKNWSTTAASNNSASPNGFPEGMAPSGVNDSGRQVMADVRSDYENREWRDWGHTVTYATATTFTIATDVTSIYTTDRPIRCTDSSTLYGYVQSSSYGAPNTTVTVVLDSGSLSASLSAVALGVEPSTISISSKSVRTSAIVKLLKGADVASAAALTLGTDGNYFDITGTTAITSIATLGVGTVVKLHFDDALTLTHHATDLILPSGANITTAAGDEAEFVEYASGDWRCTSYTRATGKSVVATATWNRLEYTAAGTSSWTVPQGVSVARITLVGGGGGGGTGGNTSPATNGVAGSAGGSSSFSTLTAAGGSGGGGGWAVTDPSTPGTGGTAPTAALSGDTSAGGTGSAGVGGGVGGNGGAVPLIDVTTSGTGGAFATNATVTGAYGGGGGGGGAATAGSSGGAGGGSGAIMRDRWFTVTPGASLSYTVGAGGAGGSLANTFSGSAGGDGVVIIEWVGVAS